MTQTEEGVMMQEQEQATDEQQRPDENTALADGSGDTGSGSESTDSATESQAAPTGRRRRRTGADVQGESESPVDAGGEVGGASGTAGGATRGSKALAKRESPTTLFDPKRMTTIGWRLDKRTSFDSWSELGQMLQTLNVSLPWWIGDWCEFGNGKYGEKYAQAIKDTGYAQQTLANYAFVCRAIPIERRREELSFTHHQEVASLQSSEQDQMLAWAVENRASAKGLRDHVAEITGKSRQTRTDGRDSVSGDGAVPEARNVSNGPVAAPESDDDLTEVEYLSCSVHGFVLAPHQCKDGVVTATNDDGEFDDEGAEAAATAGPVIDVTPEPAKPAPAPVLVADLVSGGKKLSRDQAYGYLEQHEREVVEDNGGQEPEYLTDYVEWLVNRLQQAGQISAAEAFAAGYEAAKA